MNGALYRIIVVIRDDLHQAKPITRDQDYKASNDSHAEIERTNREQNPIPQAPQQLAEGESNHREKEVQKQTPRPSAKHKVE